MKPMAHVFKSAIIIFCCHTPLSAHAANWVEAAVSEDDSVRNAISSIDTDSMRRTGSKVKFWELKKFSEPQSLVKSPQKKYKSVKTLWVCDCDARTAIVLSYTMYSGSDGGGQVIGSADFPDNPADYTNIVPDSVGEVLLNSVCAQTAKKAK